MVMRFEGHERAWRNGRDVNDKYKQVVAKKALQDRIREHKRGQRSYYANSAVETDDYWWHTRHQFLERQGENILKFPKTFENLHGRVAGAAPVLVRPFSPSIASEADNATTGAAAAGQPQPQPQPEASAPTPSTQPCCPGWCSNPSPQTPSLSGC